MTGRHTTWDGSGEESVSVPIQGGENLMVPVIRAIVRSVVDPNRIILQRRDNPSETVRGKLEIPGGRWRAGESPLDAIVREVDEETGIEISNIDGVDIDRLDDHRAIASISPLVVVAGIDGAFPAIHVVVIADGTGNPRATAGESTDVRWWSIDEVVDEMHRNRDGFIPSTFAALRTYVARLDSTGAWIASS